MDQVTLLTKKEIPKTHEETKFLTKFLKKSFLAKDLKDNIISQLIKTMDRQTYKAGERIITYGEMGDQYYVMKEGKVMVIVYEQGTDPGDKELANKVKFTKDLGSGTGFGELALMYNDKRSATIEAKDECLVFALDGNVFKGISIKQAQDQRGRHSKFLDGIPMFSKSHILF